MTQPKTIPPKTFVLIPGAWAGAWIWDEVSSALRGGGHAVHALTLPGLERGSEATDIGLDTHVRYVLDVLTRQNVRGAILVGHSYSGLVAGQVADRAPGRVGHTVYIDAFLPHDGQSLLDAFDPAQRGDERRQIAQNAGRWPAPDVAGAADGHGLSREQARWLVERQVDHPGRTVTDAARLEGSLAQQSATYIQCAFEDAPEVHRLRDEPTWNFQTLRIGHWPMVSAPAELAERLAALAVP